MKKLSLILCLTNIIIHLIKENRELKATTRLLAKELLNAYA